VTPVANWPGVSSLWWQFAPCVVDTGGKFAAGIVDTSSKFATGGAVLTTPAVAVIKFAAGVADASGALANISTNFQKIKMTRMLFSGAWGKMYHEKNLKQKIS
jgi:hypothetical protein